MPRKVIIQIHMLYTTSEDLYDRIVINGGKDILTLGQEDYSSFLTDEDYSSQEKDFPIDDTGWYEEEIKKDHEESMALASKRGLQKTFILLDWLSRLDKMIFFLKNARPDLFDASIILNLSIFIEILDTAIPFEKILIGGWGDLIERHGNRIKITRFSLIGKNHIAKRSLLEIELSSKINLSQVTIKNIDSSNLRIRGYTKILRISGVKIDNILWRPNSSAYEIKKDRTTLVIGNSEIGKLKIGVYEDSMALFSSIRIIQSSISGYIQISGIKLLHKKNNKGGLKFEYSSFHPESTLSIHNSEIEYFSSIKSTLNRLDVRNTEVSSVFLNESNIQCAYFSGISGKGLYSLIQKDNKPTHSEIREYYRNFKHSHDEIGNKVEANKFYQKEMEYYRKSLWNNGKGISEKPWQKIIISWLNDEISEYGLNWWRALLFYIMFCFFAYIFHEIIRVHEGNIYIFLSGVSNFWKYNWQDICHLNWNNGEFNEFAGYLNPVPELKGEKTLLGLIFSTLKILIVYQIVVALRRISQR